MWIVGFLTSLVYVFVFFFSKIYADMGLNIYYVFISIYGFWEWSKNKKSDNQETQSVTTQEKIIYRNLTPRLYIKVLLSFAVIFAVIYNILYHFTDSPIPVGDAFTTAAGIVATWMLAQRIIEHWIFWIIINFVSAYIYYLRGLYPTTFLYICYAILAAIGLYTWKNKGLRKNDTTL